MALPDPFPIVYTPAYRIDLGPHVFPVEKYDRLWQRLSGDPTLSPHVRAEQPEPLPHADLERVHTREYLDKLEQGRLTPAEIVLMEIPYSREIYRAMLLSCGGTWRATEVALACGLGLHLGGGYHHAFPDHGEGFCMLNDVAVAIRKGQAEGRFQRALIVDLDVHQGNGNAAIFDPDPRVFVFSMHQEHNYPAIKPPGDLDIGLPDGVDDAAYLDALARALDEIATRFQPDVVYYLAGADPYREDLLGGLGLTLEGLRQRDDMVCRWVHDHHWPLVVTLAGGYARHLEDTVTIHEQTIRTAFRVWNFPASGDARASPAKPAAAQGGRSGA